MTEEGLLPLGPQFDLATHFPLYRTGVFEGHMHPAIQRSAHRSAPSTHVYTHCPSHKALICGLRHTEIHVTRHRGSPSVTECHRESARVSESQQVPPDGTDRVSSSITEFQQVPPNGTDRISPIVTECQRVPPNAIEYHRLSPSDNKCHRTSPSVTA